MRVPSRCILLRARWSSNKGEAQQLKSGARLGYCSVGIGGGAEEEFRRELDVEYGEWGVGCVGVVKRAFHGGATSAGSWANCLGTGLGASTSWRTQATGMPAGLEVVVALGVRATGCDHAHPLSSWAPVASDGGGPLRNGHGEETGRKEKIAVIGSGNWGSVAAKLVATNARTHTDFHDEVRMWVYEETLPSGDQLSQVMNKTKENVKYLPNVDLGSNVVADPNLESTVKDATMLVFVTPHQFVETICKQLKGKVSPDAKAISLIKGMEVKPEGPVMLSNLVTEHLGIDCSVLMGANIANEVAMEKFSEATIGYRSEKRIADAWVKAFSTPYFHVAAVRDVEGVELCGTLKNVVAIAAGIVDGLEMGNNSKAAIMRIGLNEMREFSKRLFPTVSDATFFESCGVADLITTCFGGRNRKVAEAFARSDGKRSFDELETELLGGQKLQGVLTAGEVFQVLKARNWERSFPLFATVHAIATGRLLPSAIVEYDHPANLAPAPGSASDRLFH